MAEIFLSYSNADRERVHLVHEALVAEGFDVLWDQSIPFGVDWATWLREQVDASKCVIVFWSQASVASKVVRNEAAVASDQDKLVPVLLEPLSPKQFPMGLLAVQSISLANWRGDVDNEQWSRFLDAIELQLALKAGTNQADRPSATSQSTARPTNPGSVRTDRLGWLKKLWAAQMHARWLRHDLPLFREAFESLPSGSLGPFARELLGVAGLLLGMTAVLLALLLGLAQTLPPELFVRASPLPTTPGVDTRDPQPSTKSGVDESDTRSQADPLTGAGRR